MSSQSTPSQKPRRLRDVFVQALQISGKAKRTIALYVNAMEMFCAFLKGIPPLHAQANHIRAFLFHCKEERGYAPRTYNQVLYGLKAFYKTFLPDVPLMEQFRRISTRSHHTDILTRAEVEKMIRCTDNLKHRAMIELLYSTGIRVSELASMRFEHIDRAQQLITVTGKGEKQRYVPLSQRCVDTLKQYYQAFKPQGWVIPGQDQKRKIATNSIEHALRLAAQRAGIKKKCSPHILRHTFATHLLETDGRLPVVQAMLGHAHMKTTARYIHVRSDIVKTVKSPLDIAAEDFTAKGARHGKK